MHKAPIGIIHIEHRLTPDPGAQCAWPKLQQALGGGLASALLQTPERRTSHPQMHDFTSHPSAPCAAPKSAEIAFSELLDQWHYAFETIMNRRWNLCDNPYAKVWLLPGMLLLHEDPLNFAIDTHAEDILAGRPLDEPSWAILMPAPASAHEKMAAVAGGFTLPHVDLLSNALDEAAQEEGHDAICPLSWGILPQQGGVIDIVEA